jgi:hypothetical protein
MQERARMPAQHQPKPDGDAGVEGEEEKQGKKLVESPTFAQLLQQVDYSYMKRMMEDANVQREYVKYSQDQIKHRQSPNYQQALANDLGCSAKYAKNMAKFGSKIYFPMCREEDYCVRLGGCLSHNLFDSNRRPRQDDLNHS